MHDRHPSVPQPPVVQRPRRRQLELELPAWNGTLRWRVFEPSPLRAMRVLGQVAKILGPLLVQVLAGRVKLPRVAACPVCGAGDPEQINGERWLCQRKDELGALTCRHVWPLEWHRDERGTPLVLTWGLAMGSDVWRQRIAGAIHRQLEALDQDGDQVEALVCDLLLGACEFQPPGMPDWYPIRERDQLELQAAECQDGPGALRALASAAMECWVLPMLGGGRTATPPDTTASATAGGSSPSRPTPTADPSPATGRVPPQSVRRQG